MVGVIEAHAARRLRPASAGSATAAATAVVAQQEQQEQEQPQQPQQQQQQQQLFFCWTPHIVHSPLEVPAAYLSAFDFTGGRAAGPPAWNRQEYMAMVSYMDASIANVTAALKRTQMYDNTLIVFSAE